MLETEGEKGGKAGRKRVEMLRGKGYKDWGQRVQKLEAKGAKAAG